MSEQTDVLTEMGKLAAVETVCRACKKPITIKVELNPVISLDWLKIVATCNECYTRRYEAPARPQPKRKPQPATSRAARTPYNDD